MINLLIMWCILLICIIYLFIIYVYVSNIYSILMFGNNIIIYKYNLINSLNLKFKFYLYIIWVIKIKCWIKLKFLN